MWVIIITGIIGMLFIGGLAYQWSGPVLAARKGRQVDVRVRSCVQKEIPGRVSWQPTVYYEVIVDFYGLNGEALMGSIQSETPYMQGDVIHCRYLDKTGFLLSETATEVQTKAKYKLLLLLFFFIAFVGMLVPALWNVEGEKHWEFHFGSSPESTEKTAVLELSCYYEDTEREIFNYWIYLNEDGSGRILLFPMKTVSEKDIDQEIQFTVSQDNMKEITRWIQKTDVENLTQGAHRTGETMAYVFLQIYGDGEQYSGAGYCDEGIYEDIYGLIQKSVPADVWKEMEKRETAYYQR
ncbi:MAG: hypothetical protein K2H41_13440 [Acetatifactor sp.]|nr:hypothetical protein [Acetatifactor sp.]